MIRVIKLRVKKVIGVTRVIRVIRIAGFASNEGGNFEWGTGHRD